MGNLNVPDHGFDKDKNIVPLGDDQEVDDRISDLEVQVKRLQNSMSSLISSSGITSAQVACPIPVAGIYITASMDDPVRIWPGTTWIKFSSGRCLIGWNTTWQGNKYNAMTQEAGSRTTKLKLTNRQIPPHMHDIRYRQYSIPSGGEVTQTPSDQRVYSEWSGGADTRTPNERARYVLRSQFGYDPGSEIPENGKLILHNNPGTEVSGQMATYTQYPYEGTDTTELPDDVSVEVMPPVVIVAIWKRVQ